MDRTARRAQLLELARRAGEHSAAAEAIRAQVTALIGDSTERDSAPPDAPAPPDDRLARILAALERSQRELAAVRADIERAAVERDGPAPR